MKTRIGAGEFKARCLAILDDVCRSRSEVVITKRGRVVARLVPPDSGQESIFGRMAGSARITGDIVAPVGERWKADE